MLLRLPLEVRDLFREWLMANYPDRYRHVFTLIRDMRNWRDYDSQWGTRMKGTGPMAWMIGRRFEIACDRLGLHPICGRRQCARHQSQAARWPYPIGQPLRDQGAGHEID